METTECPRCQLARVAVAVVLVVVALTTSGAGKGPERLEIPTAMWQDHPPSANGERWLALCNDEKTSGMVPVRFIVLPTEPADRRQKRVSLDPPVTPKFLVQGISVIRSGRVVTLFDGTLPLAPKAIVHLPVQKDRIGEGSYIWVAPSKSARHRTYSIRLRSYKGVEQELVSYPANPGSTPTLHWAGDLDRDGMLDLLMNAKSTEQGMADFRLYLSSYARKGALVGLAASVYLGC